LGRRRRRRKEEEVALDHGGGDVAELAAVVLGVVTETYEGLFGVDRVSGHEDALGLLDHGTAPEGSLEALVFAEALESDVDRALKLIGGAVDDVSEDSALRSLVDVCGVVGVEDRADRAGSLANDLAE